MSFGIPVRNGLGIGLLASTTLLSSSGALRSLLFLFTSNEPGAWYDPSDLTTLFQDTPGTNPVTSAGQTVGLMLDKSRGLVPGSELQSAGAVGLVGVATAATYNTSTGAGSMTRVDAGNQSFVQWSGLASSYYKITISCTAGVAVNVRSGSQSGTTVLTVLLGQTKTLYALPSTGLITITSSAGVSSFTLTSIRELAGAHATQATAGSRPQWQLDGTRGYLLFDGTDDFMLTQTITPSIDKSQVFAGVRKLSDAAQGALLGLSTAPSTNSGTIEFNAPGAGLSSEPYSFQSRGTATASAAATSGYSAPSTNVLTGTGDISGDTAVLRINNVQVATSATDQGTGNYLAYPMYIGRRGGTTVPFNGRIYQMVVRFGSNLDASTISKIEAFVNSKTGAY